MYYKHYLATILTLFIGSISMLSVGMEKEEQFERAEKLIGYFCSTVTRIKPNTRKIEKIDGFTLYKQQLIKNPDCAARKLQEFCEQRGTSNPPMSFYDNNNLNKFVHEILKTLVEKERIDEKIVKGALWAKLNEYQTANFINKSSATELIKNFKLEKCDGIKINNNQVKKLPQPISCNKVRKNTTSHNSLDIWKYFKNHQFICLSAGAAIFSYLIYRLFK